MKAGVKKTLPTSVTIRLGRRKMCLTWRPRAVTPPLLRNLLRRSLRHLFGAASVALVAAWCGHALAASPAPGALPTGAQVVAGAATVTQSGASMQVVQGSAKAILDWGSFNIGSRASVNFQQPGAGSVALNRVLGNDPSALLGTLSANGKVWLINPAGILVGPGARIDVGGFIGSTLNIRNEDFLAGRLNFQAGAAAGDVVNQGKISTTRGGSVYLIAPNVENSGVINAPAGEILLAAGRNVQLADSTTPGVQINIAGASDKVTNLGEIVSEAGRVGLAGALLKNTGVISASSAVQDGGRVFLKASRSIELGATSAIAADGTSGGSISARVTQQDGHVDGSMQVDGSLSARGFGPSGNGGKVETSAGSVKVAAGTTVSTASASGKTGEWLIDPIDLTIGNVDDRPSAISGTTLGSNLETTNVTLDTLAYGGQAGDITVNAPVSWDSGNSLTLNAVGNVVVNSRITGPGSTVNLRADLSGACTTGVNGCSTVSFGYGGEITAGTTNIYYNLLPGDTPAREATLYSSNVRRPGVLNRWRLINDIRQLSGIDATVQQKYALGRDIDADQGEFEYVPIGRVVSAATVIEARPFVGTLDGNGHIIRNLTIDLENSDDVGLIARNLGTVQNLRIQDATVTGSSQVGIVAGQNITGPNNAIGRIDNVHVTGSVNAGFTANDDRADSRQVGGLVGLNEGVITRSSSGASVSGEISVGGLVGENNGSISNSYSSNGQVKGLSGDNRIGGLVGTNLGTLNSVYSASTIDSFYGGGLVGSSPYGGVISSYWDLSSRANSAGGTGLSSVEMKQQASFAGFDFNTVWRIYEGNTTPLLRSALTPLDVSAAPVTKVYNAAVTPFTGTPAYSRPVNTDRDLQGELTYGDAVNVGTYGLNGLYSTIFDIRYVPGSELTITPAPVQISGVTANNKVYNSTTVATLNGTPFVRGLGEDSLSLAGTASAQFGDKNVGIAKPVSIGGLTLAGASAGNYELAQNPDLRADITPAALTFNTAGVDNKVYDSTRNATLRQSGAVGAFTGDDVFVATPGAALFADKNVGVGKVVTVEGLTLGGADARNYVIALAGRLSADITPAPLAITGLSANSKVYDATTLAVLSGTPTIQPIGNDIVSLAGAIEARFDDKNVGMAKPVSVNGINFVGADAGNYRAVLPTDLRANITPATLTVSGIGAADKPFDGSTVARLTGSAVISPLANDQVSLLGTGTGQFTDAAVGVARPVVVSGYAIGGTDAGNYVLSQPAGVTANITAVPEPPVQALSDPVIVSGLNRAATILSPAVSGVPLMLPQLSVVIDKSPALAKAPQRFLAVEEERRKERTVLYAQALEILKRDPEAADLKPCPQYAGPNELCMPAPLALSGVVDRTASSTAPSGATAGAAAGTPAGVTALPPQARETAAPAPVPAPLPAPAEIRRKVAFLIGNNAYKRPIPRLLTPIGDAKAVAAELRDKLGYEVNTLPNATKAEMIRLLKNIAEAAERDDSVLVFYAGHGYETDDKKGFWIPVDGSPSDPSTWISNNDISKLLARIPAKQVILISDSCYSGTLASEQRIDPGQLLSRRDDILRKRSVTVMSSGGDEPVSDKGKEGHSIFAWSLLNEIREISNSEPGNQLFQQIRARVVEEYPQNPQYGAMTSAGHDSGGDYLLEKNINERPEAARGQN